MHRRAVIKFCSICFRENWWSNDLRPIHLVHRKMARRHEKCDDLIQGSREAIKMSSITWPLNWLVRNNVIKGRINTTAVIPNLGVLLTTSQCLSVQLSHSVLTNSLWPHGLQHTRLPCPSRTPGACSSSCPLSWWCHPTISSSVIPFSSCLQSFTGSFPMSQFLTSGGQSVGVSASASVLPINIQDWFPLGLTCWIFLLSKGLSRVFSNTTVQKHQFFSTQLSL